MEHPNFHFFSGGGGLALFGTGNLHTWAQSLNEFINRFTDTRKIDRSKFMDDSAYRYWEIYAQIPPQESTVLST